MREIQPQNYRCSHKEKVCPLKKKQPSIFKVGIKFPDMNKAQRPPKKKFRGTPRKTTLDTFCQNF